jgi:ribosomal protein S18 acetylase RimI-like enzyme
MAHPLLNDALSGLDSGFRLLLERFAGMVAEHSAHFHFYACSVDFELFNGVMKNRYPTLDCAKRYTERFLSTFERKKVSAYWWLYPNTTPRFEEHLSRLGLERAKSARLMAAACKNRHEDPSLATRPPPERLKITRVSTPGQLSDFTDVFLDCFNLPRSPHRSLYYDAWASFDLKSMHPHSHWLAYLEDQPVGCGQLTLSRGVAGIWSIGTLVAHRRKGIGQAITSHCLNVGKELGAKTVMLVPSDAGYSLYKMMGLEDVGHIARYRYRAGSPSTR